MKKAMLLQVMGKSEDGQIIRWKDMLRIGMNRLVPQEEDMMEKVNWNG